MMKSAAADYQITTYTTTKKRQVKEERNRF
jgi:hypothetical protein